MCLFVTVKTLYKVKEHVKILSLFVTKQAIFKVLSVSVFGLILEMAGPF